MDNSALLMMVLFNFVMLVMVRARKELLVAVFPAASYVKIKTAMVKVCFEKRQTNFFTALRQSFLRRRQSTDMRFPQNANQLK